MHISRLALDRYRSWDSCVLDFGPGVTILQGRNGLGKTNLVEAVEVLATGGSHRASSSLPLVKRGERSAVIRANVEDDGRTTTYELTVSARGANRARINGGRSVYMRDILGRIPCVTFSPEDQRLVSGDPAARRGFLNQAGALLDRTYWDVAQRFAHVAQQRGALLRQIAQAGRNGTPMDAALSGLEIWTGQFIEAGVALTRARKALTDRLSGPFADIYARLSNNGGEARLEYAPSFAEVLELDAPEMEISRHFQRIYPGEAARGVNLIGPQRDDVSVLLDGVPAREYASNGEMWTMALALRMALFRAVAEQGTRPVVILDDVFAQLDESRRAQILDFAADQDQVLITVAAASDIPEASGAAVIDVASLLPDTQEGAVQRDTAQEGAAR
ncbi:DNA recombination protein RecF [Bifidobacterium sp. DSM 109958]|uniref:DNA replication and repair protein RecF n=1 Tax=Bifidobacterium moraviense TaxID=2675323 RepID=A0A7Y0F2T9_9BIFI|nr:DNA recombination protein RecF [Bifidobacterium sp. DSM 109958]